MPSTPQHATARAPSRRLGLGASAALPVTDRIAARDRQQGVFHARAARAAQRALQSCFELLI